MITPAMITPERRAKALLPCPCGAKEGPKPVIERRARKQKLVRVRCKRCGLTSKGARLDRVAIAWNAAVLQRREERGAA
jgi:hypothetical protein